MANSRRKKFKADEEVRISPLNWEISLVDPKRVLLDRNGNPLYLSLGSKVSWKFLRIFRFVSDEDLPSWRESLGSECPRIGIEDTGVRCMSTVLDVVNGCIWSIGIGFDVDYERKISLKLDSLRSMLDVARTNQEKSKLREMHLKTRARGLRKRRAVHRTAADILTKLFSVLVRPPFETSRMVRRRGRISARITRRMQSVAHFKFTQTLKRFASQRGTRTFVSSEVYSTKICGSCGYLHRGIGGSKIFECPHCKTCEHRDGAACRKIMLRWIYEVVRLFEGQYGIEEARRVMMT